MLEQSLHAAQKGGIEPGSVVPTGRRKRGLADLHDVVGSPTSGGFELSNLNPSNHQNQARADNHADGQEVSGEKGQEQREYAPWPPVTYLRCHPPFLIGDTVTPLMWEDV
jgi:hypothetical protein